MILLDRVTKVYGNSKTPAINRVSLHIKPKEFVILVGTSGAGKSSLVKKNKPAVKLLLVELIMTNCEIRIFHFCGAELV